jgi:hypothetical protein
MFVKYDVKVMCNCFVRSITGCKDVIRCVTQASVKRCGVEMMSGEGLPLKGECVWEGGESLTLMMVVGV